VFKKIIVAVDGSAATELALSQAVRFARQSNAALTGIFIIDGGWPDFIGNDWQSTKASRQGFLDYIHQEQKDQAEAARHQFEAATRDLERASFSLLAGDPTTVLLEQGNAPDVDLLVVGKQSFQVSGRPSLKALGQTLAQKMNQPVLLLP
jgi:nucleotide-binding universal stress UspA family protein